jgi:predicted Zn-dependent protease
MMLMNNSIHNPTLRKKFDRAVRLNKDGRAVEAISILESLKKQFSQSASVVGYLGGIYFERGQLAKATDNFQRAVRLSPMSELASVGLFHSLWAAGKNDQALNEMGRFLSLAESKEYRILIRDLHLKPTIQIEQMAMAS